MAAYRNLTTSDVKAKLEAGERFLLIDVREPAEHAIAQIEGAQLMPLSQAREWVGSLPQDQEIVFFCHHGGRSQQIASFVAGQLGHPNIANMVGGIEEWALRIDPRVARY